jgi:hypothetical protein
MVQCLFFFWLGFPEVGCFEIDVDGPSISPITEITGKVLTPSVCYELIEGRPVVVKTVGQVARG